MTSAAELYVLQELDLALEADRSAIAEIQSHLDEPEELLEARRAVSVRRDELRAAEKHFREREYEADELRRKIEPHEQKLYAGSIHNPKELEDLQQEIDSLKRRRSALEDEGLEAMGAFEAAQQALAEAEGGVEELGGAYQSEHEDSVGKLARLDREVAELEEQRAAKAAEIDPRVLSLYERLLSTRQGRAVVKAQGGACQGCRISLPMNILQRARAGADLVQCTSCERILYVS